jgi:hypothetical protein
MNTTTKHLIPAFLAIAILFSACGSPAPQGSDTAGGGGGSSSSDGDDGVSTDPAAGMTCPSAAPGEQPDCPVTGEPIVADPGENPTARPVAITPGLNHVNMTTFDKHKVVDGDQLKLFFWGGVEDCYGVDHVDIEYANDVVIATIFYGNKPEAEMCIEIAEYQVVTVHLEEPLGGREIVDGALAAT